mgnify:CR=1 FL=1
MIFRFGSFELDQDLFELRRLGKPVSIEPKVLGLLMLLVEEGHRAVDKKELLSRNWPDAVVGEASLTRAVMEARKALGDDAHELIVTVRGRGFHFTSPVERVEAPTQHAALVQPTLVGRTAAQTSLLARLIAAADGRGGAVWITGEAGIGKTAIVDELSRIARGRGTWVIRVQCHDELRVPKRAAPLTPGASMPPSSTPSSPRYWSWSQLARQTLDLVDTELPGVRSFAEGSATSSGNDDFARFDAFVRDLRALSARTPLLMVMEDVQWADEASVTMLQFVARELAGSRALLVVTYRDTPHIAGARGEALSRAVHASGGVSVPLRPLSKEDVAEFVERTSQGGASNEVVTSLHGKSGGNPLYLRELMAAKVSAHRERARSNATSLSTDLTEGLRKSIEKHLDALGKPCRDLLAVASLLGQSFDLPTVTTVSGLSSDVVLDRVAEAVDARLVEKSTTGTYAFRHALVRSVLSRSLSGTDRAKAHASIGRVLDAHWGAAAGAHAEQLAHHYVRALPHGDPRRALDTSVRAAELSKTRGDLARAAVHYERALESLRHIRGEEARGVELHLALGRLRETFDGPRARESYLDAAVLASALHVTDSLCEAALGLARTDAPAETVVALLRQARSATTSDVRKKELDAALSKAMP